MLWQLILGHIAVIGGCYFTAWGITRLVEKPATPADIFRGYLFWGLFAIMGGLCFFFAPLLLK